MSVLAHVFETAGLTTIALGSQQGQITRTAPPRGLFCDFPLGRPLGRPDDAAFQHRVLDHAFSLVENATGPVVETFAESITDNGNEALSCPVPPRHDPSLPPAIDEVRGLRPAYDRAVARFGDSTAPGRVISPDGVADALAAFLRVAEGTPWREAGIPGPPQRVSQDIRGYYETAALALVEHTPAAWEATRWFYRHTEGGKAILAAQAAMKDAGEKFGVWFYLTPGAL